MSKQYTKPKRKRDVAWFKDKSDHSTNSGRQNSLTAGMSKQYTSEPSGTLGKQRVIVCYNCKGEGHMSKQYTKPKRKRDVAWFKDKTPTSVVPLPITTPTMTLRSLEEHFSKVTQTNQFAGTVSAILGIVQHYMDQQMNEAVKVAIQIQSDWLREEAQRENYEFLKTIDENIKKIIKEQVKEQVKAQVSKILPRIKQDVNEQLEAEVFTRSSHSSRTSYVVVVYLFEMDLKKILIKKIEGNNKRSIKNYYQERWQMEEPSHPEFKTGAEDQPIIQSSQHPEWFSQPQKPPTLDRDWNKTLPAVHGSIQLPTYDLMKGSCKSLIELEYHLEEVYKATTDQLDWVNPEGQQYPHNLLQPLSLIPDNRGCRVIPFAHFINNDLEYLRGGASSCKYTTSVTKTKTADYGHIKWIKDLVPRTMWIQETTDYDKHALWGVSHWGRKRQQFYGFAVNRESARDVHSNRRIIAIMELKIVEWHSYKHLDWITIRRDDDKLYKFKEGDYKRLRIQDIKDIFLLLVQGKLTNLTVEERFAFNVSLRMFTRSKSSSDVWKTFNWVSKATIRGSTLRSQILTDRI
nr:hypothetical protein [Tanacetum cinerariifolium]